MQDDSLQLTLFLTNTCNLNCVYCYEQHKDKHSMTFDCAIEWIKRCLSDTGNKFVTIYLFGGEPLLQYPLVKRICEWTWQQEWPVLYTFVLQTNGTLLDVSMKEWFSAHNKQISMCLSLDGKRETHNRNRNNSFDKIDIPYFLKTWPNQPVKMTISKDNLTSLKDDIVWIQEQGFDIRGCNLAIGEGDYSNDVYEILEEQLKLLADYYIAHPTVTIAPILNIQLSLLSTTDRPQRVSCHVGTSRLIVVNTDGSTAPCSYFSNISFKREEYEKIEEDLQCLAIEKIQCYDKCDFFPICDMCYGENYSETGNLYHPSKHKCKLMKIRIAAAMYLMGNRIAQKKTISYEDKLTIQTIQTYYQQFQN